MDIDDYICNYDFQGDDCPYHYKCLEPEHNRDCLFLEKKKESDNDEKEVL